MLEDLTEEVHLVKNKELVFFKLTIRRLWLYHVHIRRNHKGVVWSEKAIGRRYQTPLSNQEKLPLQLFEHLGQASNRKPLC